MKRQNLIAAIITLSMAAGISFSVQAAGKLYKWVDADGKVTYQDQRPPSDDVDMEVRNITDRGLSTEAKEVRNAFETSPISLYAVTDCDVCDVVRVYLTKRGVPFSEKDLGQPDAQRELSTKGARLEVPTVTVGDKVLVGYRKSELEAALDEAGYSKDADENSEVAAEVERQASADDNANDRALVEEEEDPVFKLLPQDEPFKDQ